MVVGRFVSGMPFESSSFATLPPFFPIVDDDVREAEALVFPRTPPTVQGAALFLLASLVFHSDYLQANLPANHLLHSTMLFRSPGLVDTLKPRVVLPLFTKHRHHTSVRDSSSCWASGGNGQARG